MFRLAPLIPTCAILGLCLAFATSCGGGGTPVITGASPAISSIEPSSGGIAGGTELLIRGSQLANPVAGEYQILVGGQPAEQITVISDNEVECMTPSGPPGPADVEIVTVGGTGVVPSGFMYYPPPTVTSITPDLGSRDGGIAVTVTGTGFTANNPGDTLCLIELKALENIVVIDDTTLTGLTPTSWTETFKDVTVVNRNGQDTLNAGFTYVGPVPLITSITPTEGPRSGGTFVTITGEFFTEAGGELTVRFGAAEASLVTRIDDETATCLSPLSAAPGLVDVAIGNNNGEGVLPDAFYYIPAPILSAIIPNEGSLSGGDSVTITGSGFTAVGAGTTNVTIGGNFVTSLAVVNDTTITCVTPAGASIGVVDVVILNGNGTDTLANAYTYTAPCWWETPLGAIITPTHTDDSTRSVSVGFSFPFYGGSYATMWVSSNGSITSGSYSSLSSTTLATTNQIAVHQDDLNPTYAGSGKIWSKQLPDRLVITYDKVYPYGSGIGNATVNVEAQVHLINDGTICIMYRNDGISPSFYMGINPGLGGSATTTADLSSPAGNSGNGSSTIIETFGTFDLTGGFIMFQPDGSGGYDQTFVNTIP